jgi:hypothetical protein
MVCRGPAVVSSRTQIPQAVKDPFYSSQSDSSVLLEDLAILPSLMTSSKKPSPELRSSSDDAD